MRRAAAADYREKLLQNAERGATSAIISERKIIEKGLMKMRWRDLALIKTVLVGKAIALWSPFGSKGRYFSGTIKERRWLRWDRSPKTFFSYYFRREFLRE